LKKVKKVYGSYILAIGGIFIPLAFYILAEIKIPILAFSVLIVGVMFLAIAVYFTWIEEDRKRQEAKEILIITVRELRNIRDNINLGINSLINEIKQERDGDKTEVGCQK
jgi:hypothetical protein